MAAAPHLFVALSSHGFGHLAQTAPVLNELRRRLPALRLTVQCLLPAEVLQQRIEGDFRPIAEAVDVGMAMANAMDIQVEESLAAYRAFHAGWQERLDRQEALLKRLAPELVFADIPYLPLTAAARLDIPAVALCSLHWAAILEEYCRAYPELEALRATMLRAYRSAAVFLRPAPSMPMPELANTQAIGPIAALGRERRALLNARLGLPEGETLVLAALGGIDMPLPMERWPVMRGIYWLAPAAWGVKRADIRQREAVADISFTDLLCSCDILLTKPGYGSFTEAVCNGKPVLFIERNGWPEAPWLVSWLLANGAALGISRESLAAGELEGPLHKLKSQPLRPALAPTGIIEAADRLQRYLAG